MDHSRVHAYSPLDPFSFSRPSRPRHGSVSNVDEIDPMPSPNRWNHQPHKSLEGMQSMPNVRSPAEYQDTGDSQSPHRSYSLDPQSCSAYNRTFQAAPSATASIPLHTPALNPTSGLGIRRKTTNADHREFVNTNVPSRPNGDRSHSPDFPLDSDQIQHSLTLPLPQHYDQPFLSHSQRPHHTHTHTHPHPHVPLYSPSQCPYLSRPRQLSVNSEVLPLPTGRDREGLGVRSSSAPTIPPSSRTRTNNDNIKTESSGVNQAGMGISMGLNSNSSSTTLGSPPSILKRIVTLLIDTIPRQIYLHCLLRLPYMYFSRVTQIFQDADMTLEEIKEMALKVGAEDKLNGGCSCESCCYQRFSYGYGYGYDGGGGGGGYGNGYSRWGYKKEPKSYIKLKKTWEDFIESLMKEWKTLNIVSALMISGILTVFQIEGADKDPITRYAAFWSSICALLSLLYGCIFIIRFSSMKKATRALEWALVSQKDTRMFWNVWIMLSMPVVWLVWSIIAYVLCIMSFMWRVRRDSEGSIYAHHTPPTVDFGLRIFVSGTFGLGVIYAFGIIYTLRNYGSEMDKAWRKRIEDYVNKMSMESQSQSQSAAAAVAVHQPRPPSSQMQPNPMQGQGLEQHQEQRQRREQRQEWRSQTLGGNSRNQDQGEGLIKDIVPPSPLPAVFITEPTPQMRWANALPTTSQSNTPPSPSLVGPSQSQKFDFTGEHRSSLFSPRGIWRSDSPGSLSTLSYSNSPPPTVRAKNEGEGEGEGEGIEKEKRDDEFGALGLLFGLPPSSPSTPKTKISSRIDSGDGDGDGDGDWDEKGVSSSLSLHSHSEYGDCELGDSPIKGRRGHKYDDSGRNSPSIHLIADSSLDEQTVVGTPPDTISKASGSGLNGSKSSPESNVSRDDSGSSGSVKSLGSSERKGSISSSRQNSGSSNRKGSKS